MNSSILLDFLNTAEPEALTHLPGVGPALAERICATRPFVSLEDCCRVRGVTPSFIHRLEAAMPEPEEQESPLAVTTVEAENQMTVPENVPTPTPQVEPVETPPTLKASSAKPASTSNLLQSLKSLLFFLLRLAVILFVLTGIAIGIAYLTPLAYERYIRPVEMNAAQVAALGTQQAQSEAQITSLQTRLATAEAGQVKQGEALNGLAGRIQNTEAGIAEHTRRLAELNDLQAGLLKINETSLAKMDSQIRLLKAMEMLSRARLFLYQSNFGLAKQDAQSAREILAGLQEAAPEELSADLTESIFRLDLVLKNLPAFPVAASDDLDLAWQVLVQGIPHPTQTPAESLTPEPDITATPAPTATP